MKAIVIGRHELTGKKDAIKFVNPRAKVEEKGQRLTVAVDPPMKFKFSHIEWY